MLVRYPRLVFRVQRFWFYVDLPAGILASTSRREKCCIGWSEPYGLTSTGGIAENNKAVVLDGA